MVTHHSDSTYFFGGVPKMIIFSPGPANISQRVRNALTLPDICHRDSEFSELLTDIKRLITWVVGVEEDSHEVVLFSGSGTLVMESLLACLTGWDKTLLIVSNGIYGERAFTISYTLGIKAGIMGLGWRESVDLSKIEEVVRRPEIGGVYLVHHETTTGLLNPLMEVSQLAKCHNKMVLADTISSLGGENLSFDWGLDGILGSANKCLRGIPGVSFIIISKAFLSIARRRIRHTYYSDLVTHIDREAGGETPFTPAIQVLFALKEALKELLEEGVENRIANYRNISQLLRRGLKELGLKLFLPEELYSNTMTSVYLPPGISYQELHDALKEEGFVIYNSQRYLQEKVFMLGTVGVISERDIQDFLEVLGGKI